MWQLDGKIRLRFVAGFMVSCQLFPDVDNCTVAIYGTVLLWKK